MRSPKSSNPTATLLQVAGFVLLVAAAWFGLGAPAAAAVAGSLLLVAGLIIDA